ncbi:MAG TPA: nitroreductase family protein [Aggregatilineales bacterium]|nr:nitroreductase family protein [Anaerolineales bacterium]HRE46310.1 nitroreductase family protein [Aggregatilineales bacterium]
MPATPAQFHPLVFDRLPLADQHQHSNDFLARMSARRTVRLFSSEPVPFVLIENAIATANTAPSGANQQPWTFVVVGDPDLKRQIRIAAEEEEKESYERRMSQEWLDALAPLGTDWHKPHLEDAPYLIVVFRQAYSMDAEGNKVKHYYTEESVGIAVGMLLCSLHLAGLATLTHTPNPMAFLSALLQRPANERAYVVLPVGYPAADAHVPVIQKKGLKDVMICFGAPAEG